MEDRNSTAITRKDMTKFPREAQDLVLHLVNNEGIRWRIADHNHILLYPPDGVGRPFKISSSRPAEATNRYIRGQFMKAYDIKDADGNVPGKEEEVVAAEVVTAKETGDAAEAVRTLATALGVSLGGTVSEEDYLQMMTERDMYKSLVESQAGEIEGKDEQIEVCGETIHALTEQRDRLLIMVDRAKEALNS